MRNTRSILWLLVTGFSLAAQGADTGSLTGNVSDQAGAKLSYVIVSLMNSASSAQSFTHSTPQGGFRLANLPVGDYTMNVSAAGFCKAQIEGIVIQRHQNVSVQLTLSPVESMVVKVPVNSRDESQIVKAEISGLQARLALSNEQQAQMQNILAERQKQITALLEEQALAEPERREKTRVIRQQAEAKMRTLLTENQLEEYDEILRERRERAIHKRESGMPSLATALSAKSAK